MARLNKIAAVFFWLALGVIGSAQVIMPGPVMRPLSDAGAIATWSVVQSNSFTSNAIAITNVYFNAPVTAGNTLALWAKWETTAGAITNTIENGGGTFSTLTETNRESGNLNTQWKYLLSATGGGTNIALQWSSTATFTRIIIVEMSHGGTASLVSGDEGMAGADSGTSMVSAAVSNSGTQRINLCGYGGFNGATITDYQIGGVAGSPLPAAQVSDAWVWWNAEALSAETATGTRSSSEGWILHPICFAAN